MFGSKQKEAEAKVIAMATSQYEQSCVFLKAQSFCQVSVILLKITHFFLRYILHFMVCLSTQTTYNVIISIYNI